MNSPPIRVLLVETDRENYRLLRDRLSKSKTQQFQLEWVATTEAAIASIQTQQYEIYLIDDRLGMENEWELLREAAQLTSSTAIVVLLESENRERESQALKAGATDCLTKADLQSSLFDRYLQLACDRQNAIATFHQCEERWSQWFEKTRDAIHSVAIDGSFLAVNPAWQNCFGYDAKDRETLSVFDMVHPDSLSAYQDLANRAIAGEKIEFFELKIVTKTGEIRIVEGNSRCESKNGIPITRYEIFRPIADRQQSQENSGSFTEELERRVGERTAELRATNAVLHQEVKARQQTEALLFQQNEILEAIASDIPLADILDRLTRAIESQTERARCAILLLDPNKTTLHYAIDRSLPEGYRQEMPQPIEIGPNAGSCGTAVYLGEPVVVTDIATDPRCENYKELALKYGLHACWSVPIRSSTGEIIGTFATYYSTPKSPSEKDWQTLDRFVPLAGIAIESKQNKQALKISEERFRRAFMDAPFPIAIHAEDGEMLQINQVWTELTGYDRADIPTIADWTERAYGERQTVLRSQIDRLYQLNERLDEGEFVITTRAGTERIWSFSSAPLGLLPDGRRLVISMAVDITERQQTQEKLQESQQRLQAILDNAPAAIYLKDTESRLLLVNQQLEKIVGLPATELIHKSDGEFLSEEIAEAIYANDRQVLRNKIPLEFEEIIEQADGVHTYLSIKFPLFDRNGNVRGIGGISTDISDRIQTQKALEIQAQKQAAIAYLGQQALSGMELSALFDEVTALVAERLEADYCDLLELIRERNVLLRRSAVGWPPETIGNATVEAGEPSQLGYTLRMHQPVVVADLRTETRFQESVLWRDRHLVSGISVVILDGDLPFGVLSAHTTEPRHFTSEDANFLQAVANVLTAAIEQQKAELERENLLEQLERERSLFEAVLQQMPAGVGIAEAPSGKPILSNQQVGQILGYPWQFVSFAEYADYKGFTLNGEPLLPQQWPLARAIYQGEIVRGQEIQYQHDDGSYSIFQANAAPIRDRYDRIIAGVVIVLNITARKQAEAQVHQLNATLEQRVQQRTRQLEEANAELEAFSYSVSHDLRAPLRSMQGFSIALLEDYGDRLNHIGREYAGRIISAAERMDALIQDLLTYSRLSRAELQLQPIDLDFVLAEVLAEIEPQIAERSAHIVTETPLPIVRAHRRVLVQVVTNLLVNAIKFVPPEVQPVVRLRTEERDGWVRLWVRDNGIGIAAEHQKRIFGVFERLHGEDSYPGTGIGLAIVRKGIERLGGRVGVESIPGEGSQFWIELPRCD